MAQTTNYQLPLHEPYTRPTAQGWNDNQNRLDGILTALNGAVTTKAEQTAVGQLNSRVDTLAERIKIVIGSYTGNNQSSQTIQLGATPKGVLLEYSTGARVNDKNEPYGGFFTKQQYLSGRGLKVGEIIEGGFIVRSASSNVNSNEFHHYIAFL